MVKMDKMLKKEINSYLEEIVIRMQKVVEVVEQVDWGEDLELMVK